jgi:hypothetical protein
MGPWIEMLFAWAEDLTLVFFCIVFLCVDVF